MAKGQSQQTQEQPKEVTPKSERTLINGREVSSRKYSNANQTYTNKINLTNPQKKGMDFAENQYYNLLQKVPQLTNVTPERHQQFANQLYQPQRDNLVSEYQSVLGQAQNTANASGVLNSIGFENYRANQLDKNLAKGLTDIRNQAELQAYDLPSMQLQPITQGLNIFGNAINAPLNNGLQMLDPSFQGSQSSNNFALQSRNQFNAERQYLDQQNAQRNRFLGIF